MELPANYSIFTPIGEQPTEYLQSTSCADDSFSFSRSLVLTCVIRIFGAAQEGLNVHISLHTVLPDSQVHTSSSKIIH